MDTKGGNWINYWDAESLWSTGDLWQIDGQIFVEKMMQLLEIKADDRVLDIGCGTGWVETLLAPHVKQIHAVDTAPSLVEVTRSRCAKLDNVTTQVLGEPFTDISRLEEKPSLILCKSVIQYYRNVGEVESLIQSARKTIKPGGRMLISDINLKRNKLEHFWDMCCSLLKSIRGGYASTMVLGFWKRRKHGAEYARLEATEKLLSFSMEEIEQLIERLDLKAEIIRTNLSVSANRPSLLISF